MSVDLIVLILLSIGLLFLDRYLVNRFRQTFPNARFVQSRIVGGIYWGLSILVIVAAFVGRYSKFGIGGRAACEFSFFLSIVIKVITSLFLFVDDIRIAQKIKKAKAAAALQPVKEDDRASTDISRSKFLARAGLLAAAAIPAGGLIYGIASGSAYDYHIRRVKLYLPNLPKQFDGLKLAQISDIHSGSFYNKKAVTGGVEMLMREKADIIFFTGDLVNNRTSEMRDYQDIFTKVKAPLGVFSSLGNHDYGYYDWWPSEQARVKNFEDLLATHKNMGWQLLRNENRPVKVDGEEIAILGVENWGLYSKYPVHGRVEMALKNTEDMPVKLLLSHDPTHWRAKVLPKYPQIDVSFAGHTHGMQMGVYTPDVRWSPIQYAYPEWAGLYREGHQQLYVNVGYGFLAYAGRLGILPEITIFELKASTDPALKA